MSWGVGGILICLGAGESTCCSGGGPKLELTIHIGWFVTVWNFSKRQQPLASDGTYMYVHTDTHIHVNTNENLGYSLQADLSIADELQNLVSVFISRVDCYVLTLLFLGAWWSSVLKWLW